MGLIKLEVGETNVQKGKGTVEQQKKEPILAPIKNGWAALGDGWAVHGRTPEEAIQKFHEAEERHREIDVRPFRYEQVEVQSI